MAGHFTYTGNPLLCRKCKEHPLAKPSGYPKHCKSCINANQRNWRKRNPEKCLQYKDKAKVAQPTPWYIKNPERDRINKRKNKLLTKFGITPQCYERMLSSQNGCCAICKSTTNGTFKGRPKNFAIDHCHVTGNVRGLLCSHCNWAIGHFRDSTELLNAAIKYINKAKINAESKRI